MSNDLTIKTNEYSYAEKLNMVASGQMAPEEIGVATAEDAQKLMVLDAPPPGPHLGDFCTFEVSEVPHALRAKWAKQERKIIEAGDFEADWIEKNKDNHLLQARFRCGNISMMLEQTVTDVVRGFAQMLAQAGGVLDEMKTRYDAGNFTPAQHKDPVLAAKQAIAREV